MYSIAEGKASFLTILGQLEPALSGFVAVSEVTTIGLTCASISGGISFSATRMEILKTTIPAEFEFPSFVSFESPASPMREWTQVYWNDDGLLAEDGRIIEHWLNNEEFATPIVMSVCMWMDEAFTRSGFQKLKPRWLVVDEVDGGINRVWSPGALEHPSK